MGYRIDYIHDMHASGTGAERNYGRMRALIAVLFICMTLTVKSYWPEGTERMRDFLLPQRVSAGQACFQALISDLRQEVALRDALTVFCTDLLAHAENA